MVACSILSWELGWRARASGWVARGSPGARGFRWAGPVEGHTETKGAHGWNASLELNSSPPAICCWEDGLSRFALTWKIILGSAFPHIKPLYILKCESGSLYRASDGFPPPKYCQS